MKKAAVAIRTASSGGYRYIQYTRRAAISQRERESAGSSDSLFFLVRRSTVYGKERRVGKSEREKRRRRLF